MIHLWCAIGSLAPIRLDVCVNGVLRHEDRTIAALQESKIPDQLNGCTFKFCARISEPFVNENCTTGLEIQIIDLVQSILKFEVSGWKGDGTKLVLWIYMHVILFEGPNILYGRRSW